jgi:hypothetical protein
MSEKRANDPETVWKTMKKVGVAMIVTHKDGKFDGRPPQAFPEPDVGKIDFMMDPHDRRDQRQAARVAQLCRRRRK